MGKGQPPGSQAKNKRWLPPFPPPTPLQGQVSPWLEQRNGVPRLTAGDFAIPLLSVYLTVIFNLSGFCL